MTCNTLFKGIHCTQHATHNRCASVANSVSWFVLSLVTSFNTLLECKLMCPAVFQKQLTAKGLTVYGTCEDKLAEFGINAIHPPVWIHYSITLIVFIGYKDKRWIRTWRRCVIEFNWSRFSSLTQEHFSLIDLSVVTIIATRQVVISIHSEIKWKWNFDWYSLMQSLEMVYEVSLQDGQVAYVFCDILMNNPRSGNVKCQRWL
jgi:hypothetical protein